MQQLPKTELMHCSSHAATSRKCTSAKNAKAARILHLMKERKIFVPTAHATKLAETLEGDTNASIRAKLGELPPKEVKDAIEILIKSIIE